LPIDPTKHLCYSWPATPSRVARRPVHLSNRSEPMQLDEVMAQLEALGTEQNRKTYARHGVKSAMFGVSYANLDKLKKKIKVDHPLAEALWATGNHDARVLATKIADPQQPDLAHLQAWAHDLDSYVICDAFSG